MEQFLYTYLNKKYGLRNLVINWAASIVQAIHQYSKLDIEVLIFGKILNNTCDEAFMTVIQRVHQNIHTTLKLCIKDKHAGKAQSFLNK